MEDIQQILQENALLKAQILLRDEQILIKEEELLRKDEQILIKEEELLRKNERILYLERQLFGRRSEKELPSYNEAQLSLFDSEQGLATLEQESPGMTTLIEDIRQKAAQRYNTSKHKSTIEKRSYKLPADIERRETIIEPANIDTNTLIKIGEDVSERLMLDPSKFWVERTVRPVYKVKEAGQGQPLTTTIVQAPAKEVILPGCIAGESLLSQLIVDKFLYHLPEYRQAKRFKELGVELPTSSINRWIHATADKLYPLYAAQMQRVLSANYIQVDETTHSITDRQGSARKGYIWVVRSVLFPGVFFHYDKGSRSQEVVLKMLKDYKGALQTDGYAAYSIFEEKQGVLPLGCMAHIRRKFENALITTPQAKQALDYIALLYMLEGNLKEEGADYEKIRKEREQKAYPILQQMESWMKQTYNSCTPKSPLGKAISYAFGMWPRISRYCKEGYFNIDNNAVENAIRPITLGRKNYLFSGNDSGAEDNCVFYTLLGSCLQAGVEPHKWLTSTLEIIPKLKAPINWEEQLP
jgi:transposase